MAPPTHAKTTSALPLRALLGIALVVLAIHLALLHWFPVREAQTDTPPPLAFTTRTITLNPPAPATPIPPAPPPPVVAAKPARPAPPRPAPVRRTPVAAPSPAQVLAPESPTDSTTTAQATDNTPADTTHPAVLAAAEPAPPPVPAPPAEPAVAAATAPTAPSAPITIPGSVKLLYNVEGQVKKMAYQARSELQWLHDGKNYDMRFEVSLFMLGSRVQTSRGTLTERGLAPLRFSDKSRTERAAHFDYDKGRVTFSANSADAPLTPGAQDRLSAFIQLGALLAGDPGAFPSGTTITQQTIGPRDADVWTAVVGAQEKIRVKGDELLAVKVMHVPARDFDSKVELWYAPSMGYLPVRIRITQPNGDFADMQLRATEAP